MRGQIFSFDFIFAVSVIVFLFAIALFISDDVANVINERDSQRDLQLASSTALSVLIETPGDPSNWNNMEFSDSNVKSIGLVSQRNVLDEAKLRRFYEIADENFENYTQLKRTLAIDLPSSNFSLIIYNASNFIIFETAYEPPSTADVHSLQRLAIIDNKPATVNLRIWVEK